MSAVSPEELWSLWKKGVAKVEHCMGQVLQILMDQARTIKEHGIALTRQEQQIERLSKEVRDLRKEVKALRQVLDGK